MIELVEAIRQLREQLATAATEGRDERLRFGLDSIELELQVAATREGGATAGIMFWVIGAGAEGKVSKQSLQKVKLVLRPRMDGRHLEIAAEAVRSE